MAHACKQRMTSAGEGMQAQSITITEYWDEQLKEMPFLSRKCLSSHLILQLCFDL